MAFISLNITVILCGSVKLILRLTFQGLKPNRANHVLIYSSVQTVKMIIKQIWINVYSKDIVLIDNGMPKSTKNSMTTRSSWFVQL